MRKTSIATLAAGWTAAVTLLSGSSNPAAAYQFKVLYSFCEQANCTDGGRPPSGLIMDGEGNLYGVTFYGGAKGGGAIFELSSDGSGNWSEKVLYSFCAIKKCADGEEPDSTLIMDTAGNLYGTTYGGGRRNSGVGPGTVFKLIPNADRSEWQLQVLYAFCSKGGKTCTDGSIPYGGGPLSYSGASSGAPYDGVSPLYGTTEVGGTGGDSIDGAGSGTAYELLPDQSGWKHKVLYSFCSVDKCTDGSEPAANLTMDSSGVLYGTTQVGGLQNSGVVFQLKGRHANWHEAALYSFCSAAHCSDGSVPSAELSLDGFGGLLGTTFSGGKYSNGAEFTLTQSRSSWTENVVHDFCGRNYDGCNPGAALNELYGTTVYGGKNGKGVVFNGLNTVVYSFCGLKSCADGSNPNGELLLDSSGNIYGTTFSDGLYGGGNVFELTP